MPSAVLIFCAICFILVQINFANGENNGSTILYKNTTNVLSPSKSGRSKRSLIDEMPFVLKIDVLIGQELNSLTWYSSRQNYFANEHLPVEIPLDEIHRVDNIMEDVGDFVMYHDIEKHSAMVYFGKTKTFFGVIGANYFIQNLPYNFDENYKYREILKENEYLKKRAESLFQNLPGIGLPTTSDTNNCEISKWNQNDKRPCDSEAGPSSKQLCTEQVRVDNYEDSILDFDIDIFNVRKRRAPNLRNYFLESLILVCRDIVDIFKKSYGNDYLVWIVRYFIIYFNAVDLTFRKLRGNDAQLRINIARIVIDNDLVPFTFINDGELQYPEIVSKLPQYLETNSFEYPPDSFDHVFLFTSRTIFNKEMPILGSTKYGADLYDARKNKKNYYEVVPITVTTVKPQYDNYLFTVQEIGRVLELDIDPFDDFLKVTKKCCDSNQEGKLQCHECLKWTDNSVIQFNEFFNKNLNRCFFLNLPRSIHSPGAANLISPHTQCQCFGYNFYGKAIVDHSSSMIGRRDCNTPVRCTKVDGDNNYHEPTVRPFDGTPCGRVKVCWEGRCKSISNFAG